MLKPAAYGLAMSLLSQQSGDSVGRPSRAARASGATGAAAGQGTIRPAHVLVIVCAGVVMASLDLFIVNVALPQIAVDLHEPSLGTLSWVLNGYAIIYAALLVLAGRLADQHNRKNGFLLGVAIFTAGSAACGAATTVPMLIAFRLVQAAGAALLTPTSLGLVLASYPGRAARWRGASLDRCRRQGRRPRPGDRRPAGSCQLALGVLRQRADRHRRAADRLAQAAGPARPSRRTARRAVGQLLVTAGVGRPDPGPCPRRSLGLGRSAATTGVLAASAIGARALRSSAASGITIRSSSLTSSACARSLAPR